MVLDSYVLYKENLPTGKKPMTRLSFNISIIEELSKEWLQEKNLTPGTSKESTLEENKLLKKLPQRKEKD